MTADGRLDRLYPALSAKERALLILQCVKEQREEDPRIRNTMPWQQGREVNRLIGLMNACNVELACAIFILKEQVQQLDIKCAWLRSLHLWGLEMSALAGHMAMFTKEPVTESGLRLREQELRAERLTLAQAAEMLVEGHDGWTPADYDGDGQDVVTDEAWSRVLREKKRQLSDAIKAGALRASGKGGRARLTMGALHDWLDEPMPVFPDWGCDHDVFPDERADEVARLQAERGRVQALVRRAPGVMNLPYELSRPPKPDPDKASYGDDLAHALAWTIRDGVQTRWRELRCVDVVLGEAAEEFDGEDPLRPDARELFEEAKGTVREVRDEMLPYAGEFELPEAGEEELALTRKLVERAGER